MYADVRLKQTAMNVVLQVLPHPAPETNGLIRELASWRVGLPAWEWGVGWAVNLKRLLFIPPHSTNDLFQCEINFDNVYFTYK